MFNLPQKSIRYVAVAQLCFKNAGSVWLLPSQRDGQVEDREHHGAAVISEQVSDNGGRDGGVAGLSDTHQTPREHKQPVVLQRKNERERQKDVRVCYQAPQETFYLSITNKNPFFMVRNLFPHQLFFLTSRNCLILPVTDSVATL